MVALGTSVLVRYLAQDDARQSALATKLLEERLTAAQRGFVSLVTLLETVWVMESCYGADGDTVAGIVADLLDTPTLDVQGFVMYRAPMRTEQGRMSAMTMTNVALRQKLRGDRSSVSLRVMDPFNTMGMGFVTDDGRFYQTSERKFGARGVFLSFNYAFGQQPRLRPRAQEPQPDASASPAGQQIP